MTIIESIATKVKEHGGDMYYVGGYVRDRIMGRENKDIDVEVFGITAETLRQILSGYGEVDTIGASYGVLKVKGLDIDFSMPRRDRKNGTGNKGFDVYVDPHMSLKEASMRRDLTCNALMEHVLTGEVIDLWGGTKDIKQGVIRHVDDETFGEDSLRGLRACKFAGRFGFRIAPETIDICRLMNVLEQPKERIMGEVSDMLLKSHAPSVALGYLYEIGGLKDVIPEMVALRGCEQNPEFHPEGDVWNHTMLVIDQAAKVKHKTTYPLGFMMSALLHDIGKPAVTTLKEGRIIAHGHEREGEAITLAILKRLTDERKMIQYVTKMVKHHMKPLHYYPNASDRLFRELSMEVPVVDMLHLTTADQVGSGGKTPGCYELHHWFQGKIDTLELDKPIVPVINGKELIALGMKPGRELGNVLNSAFRLQLEGFSKEEILERLGRNEKVALVTGEDLIRHGLTPGKEFGELLKRAFRLQRTLVSKNQKPNELKDLILEKILTE